MAGKEFAIIYLPLKKQYFDWALLNSEELQIALLNYPGTCSIHFPSHKLFQAKLSFRERPLLSEVPLEAVTIFCDGSVKTHCLMVTWQDPETKKWKQNIQIVEGSTQVVELAAVVRAFQLFPEPFNLITDSAYVANIVKRVEGSVLKDVSNNALYRHLKCLYTLVQNRTNQYFVSHIRAHSSLPGLLVEGNSRAD